MLSTFWQISFITPAYKQQNAGQAIVVMFDS